MVGSEFHSAIYRGWVRHRRFQPKAHSFRYDVFMMYVDLAELDDLLALSPWWSKRRFALARFKRSDYFGNADLPLDQAIRTQVLQRLDVDVSGAVRMLTNFRYFGYLINPLTVYYCFDTQDRLSAMLLEVTNTPWGERHQYVMACDPTSNHLRTTFDKAMHVSPFHPMDMTYHWRSATPGKQLTIHMQNCVVSDERDDCVFDATLRLERQAITARALSRVVWRYPFMTAKVCWGIYWQALKLYLKKVPFFSNPQHSVTQQV